MFTRGQTVVRPTTKGVALVTTESTSATNGSSEIQIPTLCGVPVNITSDEHHEPVIPSVSLTITAVATELDADGKIAAATTEVPVLDTPTITNLVVFGSHSPHRLSHQLENWNLNSLEGGLHCGVPTRTTPTLTPTTLRNIEQTFLELGVPAPETHNNQAGFVPPLVQPNTAASTSGGTTFISLDNKCWGGGVATLTTAPAASSGSLVSTASTSATTSSGLPRQHPMYTSGALFNTNSNSSTSSTGSMPSLHGNVSQPGRRMGGRRPNNQEHLTPEEEERRKLRRERNKMAAARCRKRRLDQTNCLQDETDDLEDKKSSLQQEIQLLQQQRDELEFLLATHKAVCRRRPHNNNVITTTVAAPVVSAPPSITTSVVTSANPIPVTSRNNYTNNNVTVQSLPLKEETPPQEDVVIKEEPQETQDDIAVGVLKIAANKPRRPTSLNVAPLSFRNATVADLGVPIETPSAGLRGLNFESMMDGGTGLTPVTNGTGLTPLSTGLTPLTTPIVTAPSQSSTNCSSQQRSSSSDLSSPDSVVPPKLVSL